MNCNVVDKMAQINLVLLNHGIYSQEVLILKIAQNLSLSLFDGMTPDWAIIGNGPDVVFNSNSGVVSNIIAGG